MPIKSLSVAVLMIAGCATYSQIMIGPEGEVVRCTSSGGGAMGMGVAESASSTCVEDYKMLGYREIEMVGVIGVKWDGLTIAHVEPKGPAIQAGIKRGDVVTHVDGSPVETEEELRDLMKGDPLKEVSLTIERDGTPMEFLIRRRAYQYVYGSS